MEEEINVKQIPQGDNNHENKSQYSQQMSNGFISSNERILQARLVQDDNIELQDNKQKQGSEQNSSFQSAKQEQSKQIIELQSQQQQRCLNQRQNANQQYHISQNIGSVTKMNAYITSLCNVYPNQKSESAFGSSRDLNEYKVNPKQNKRQLYKQKTDNYRPEFFNSSEWDNLPQKIEDFENKTQQELRHALPKRMTSLIRKRTILQKEIQGSLQQQNMQCGQQQNKINQLGDEYLSRNLKNVIVSQTNPYSLPNILDNQNDINIKNSETQKVNIANNKCIQKLRNVSQYNEINEIDQIDQIKRKGLLLKKYITEEVKKGVQMQTEVKEKAQTFDQKVKVESLSQNKQLHEISHKSSMLDRIDRNVMGQSNIEQKKVKIMDREVHTLEQAYNEPDRIQSDQCVQISCQEKINIVRRWIFITFEDPQYSLIAKIICVFMQLSIAFSCAIFILNTVYLTDENEQNYTDNINFNHVQDQTDTADNTGNAVNGTTSTVASQDNQTTTQFQFDYALFQMYGEFVVSVIFTTDLVLRVLCCGSFGLSIKSYIKKTVNLIDLISIIPFFVSMVFNFTHLKSLNILRVVRLLRIVRIFKLSKYIRGIYILQKAIQRSHKQLLFVINLVLVISLFSSTILYYFEKHLQHQGMDESTSDTHQIQSIPEALWFVLVTMTTVGYGDKLPFTIPGKIISICIAFMGSSLMIGLPIAIISHDFQAVYKEEREKERLNNIKKLSLNRFKNSITNKTNSAVGSNLVANSIISPVAADVYSQQINRGVVNRFQSFPGYPITTNGQITLNKKQDDHNHDDDDDDDEDKQIPLTQLQSYSANPLRQQNISSVNLKQYTQFQAQANSINFSPIITRMQNQSQQIDEIKNQIKGNDTRNHSFANSSQIIQGQEYHNISSHFPQEVSSELYEKRKSFIINENYKQYQELNNQQIKQEQKINQKPHFSQFHQKASSNIQQNTNIESNPNTYKSGSHDKSDSHNKHQQSHTRQTSNLLVGEGDGDGDGEGGGQINNVQQYQSNNIISDQQTHQFQRNSDSFKMKNVSFLTNMEGNLEDNQNEVKDDCKEGKDDQKEGEEDDDEDDHEYQAQIEYMANRLKQISKTNKMIRELTIRISKMSYVVTLDIADLYHTFSKQKQIFSSFLIYYIPFSEIQIPRLLG